MLSTPASGVNSEHRIRISPKQAEFLRDTQSRYLLASGAFGSAKSSVICMKLVQRASVPGAVEFLCRKTLVSLKGSTLRTLLKGSPQLPPILPSGSYSHHKTDKIITIHGGGEIMYFGLDDPEKVASFEASGIAIDEVVELTPDDFTMLDGRVRRQVPGLAPQMYGACNPSTPSHFLAKRFGLGAGNLAPLEGHHCIHSCTTDNPFLDDDYIKAMDSLEGIARKRFFLGEWAGAEGLVYDTWDRTTHVQDRSGDIWPRAIIGCDDGYTNPFAALLLLIDGDGRIHVAHEVYQSGLAPEQKVAEVKALASCAPLDIKPDVVVDPSSPALIDAMRRAGLHATAADNSVFDGIMRVQQQLRVRGDGHPGLTVDARCVNLLTELETYEWKEGRDGTKDEPRKFMDHACDALRYGIMHATAVSTAWIGGVVQAWNGKGTNGNGHRKLTMAQRWELGLDD